MLEGKWVLVTGGTGAIGGRLVEKLVLEQRARVRVLVRNFMHASRLARFPLEMVGGDLADPAAVNKAVQGCEVVFHCAYDFSGDPVRQRKSGIDGTRHLCEAALLNKVARLVHVSSVAVYGPTLDGDLDEKSPWRKANNTYWHVKAAAERLVLQMCRERQLPGVVLQPTLVYGPFSGWTMNQVQELKTGIVPLVDGGGGYCNAVYLDDVIDSLILAATRAGVTGEAFLISGDQPVTWKEFYGAHEAVLGVQATASFSEFELRRAMTEKKQQSRSLAQLVKFLRQPGVKEQLLGLPVMRPPLSGVKSLLGQSRWDSLKAATFGGDGLDNANGNGEVRRALCVPHETQLALYRSKTRVRIDKARSLLGYAPRFDFRSGMEMTARFIRWANLV
jgi:nucleoside-diphosphate-sugar epimerase